MPLYRVERYEVHTQAYLVQADSEAEAVKKTLDGLAEVAPDEFSERLSFCDSLGLETKYTPRLTAALRKLGVELTDKVIPSVRSVAID